MLHFLRTASTTRAVPSVSGQYRDFSKSQSYEGVCGIAIRDGQSFVKVEAIKELYCSVKSPHGLIDAVSKEDLLSARVLGHSVVYQYN
jgi:hypothetical protein